MSREHWRQGALRCIAIRARGCRGCQLDVAADGVLGDVAVEILWARI
jgi:hypothetical protein